MAKGSEAKQFISKKILETFEGSFICADGKEIRIPYIEDGAEVQIKVTLTAAKTNVERNAETEVPSVIKASLPQEITEEEKQAVKELLNSLDL